MGFMEFARAALACYFTFIAVFYTAKLLALRARTGVSHAARGPRGTTQWVGHSLFAVFRLAIWLVCVARVAAPGLDAYLGPIPVLTHPAPAALGLALLLVSLFIIVYTHSYMGEAWRSGVAEGGPSRLITDGPFGRVRHPVFTAIALGQLGFFLAFPSLFSLLCLVAGLAVLMAQARFEERRMAETFGKAWHDYARLVPALLPRRSAGQAPAGSSEPA